MGGGILGGSLVSIQEGIGEYMNSNSAFDIAQDIILALHGRISELEAKLTVATQVNEVHQHNEREMEEELNRWRKMVTKSGMAREFGKLIDDSKQYVSEKWGKVGTVDGQHEIYYQQGIQEGLRRAIRLINGE